MRALEMRRKFCEAVCSWSWSQSFRLRAWVLGEERQDLEQLGGLAGPKALQTGLGRGLWLGRQGGRSQGRPPHSVAPVLGRWC